MGTILLLKSIRENYLFQKKTLSIISYEIQVQIVASIHMNNIFSLGVVLSILCRFYMD